MGKIDHAFVLLERWRTSDRGNTRRREYSVRVESEPTHLVCVTLRWEINGTRLTVSRSDPSLGELEIAAAIAIRDAGGEEIGEETLKRWIGVKPKEAPR